jgi:hypothetical protein
LWGVDDVDPHVVAVQVDDVRRRPSVARS